MPNTELESDEMIQSIYLLFKKRDQPELDDRAQSLLKRLLKGNLIGLVKSYGLVWEPGFLLGLM